MFLHGTWLPGTFILPKQTDKPGRKYNGNGNNYKEIDLYLSLHIYTHIVLLIHTHSPKHSSPMYFGANVPLHLYLNKKFPKNHWTLLLRGLDVYSRGLGSPNHQFWDPMILRVLGNLNLFCSPFQGQLLKDESWLGGCERFFGCPKTESIWARCWEFNRWFFYGFYHGKSPLNHHLGNICSFW